MSFGRFLKSKWTRLTDNSITIVSEAIFALVYYVAS